MTTRSANLIDTSVSDLGRVTVPGFVPCRVVRAENPAKGCRTPTVGAGTFRRKALLVT